MLRFCATSEASASRRALTASSCLTCSCLQERGRQDMEGWLVTAGRHPLGPPPTPSHLLKRPANPLVHQILAPAPVCYFVLQPVEHELVGVALLRQPALSCQRVRRKLLQRNQRNLCRVKREERQAERWQRVRCVAAWGSEHHAQCRKAHARLATARQPTHAAAAGGSAPRAPRQRSYLLIAEGRLPAAAAADLLLVVLPLVQQVL